MYQRLSKILFGTPGGHMGFWCPGCQTCHNLRVPPMESPWTWNGDPEHPTFQPSVLVTSGHFVTGQEGKPCWCTFEARSGQKSRFHCYRCHSYVTDGVIKFLGDCSHELAGQEVALPELPQSVLEDLGLL